jgi:hypothetical protein
VGGERWRMPMKTFTWRERRGEWGVREVEDA